MKLVIFISANIRDEQQKTFQPLREELLQSISGEEPVETYIDYITEAPMVPVIITHYSSNTNFASGPGAVLLETKIDYGSQRLDDGNDRFYKWLRPFADGICAAERLLTEPHCEDECQTLDENYRSAIDAVTSEIELKHSSNENFAERIFGKILPRNPEPDFDSAENVWCCNQDQSSSVTAKGMRWDFNIVISKCKDLLRQRYHFTIHREPESALLKSQSARIEQFCDHPYSVGLVFGLVLLNNREPREIEDETGPFEHAKWFAEKCGGIKVRLDDFDDVPACLIRTPEEKVVFLYSGLNEAERTWSLCHETAHIMLQHNPMFFVDRLSLSAREKIMHDNQEAEAEALACLLSVMFGVKQIPPLPAGDSESNPAKQSKAGRPDNVHKRHPTTTAGRHSPLSHGTPADQKACIRRQRGQAQPGSKTEGMTCGEE